MSSPSIDPTAAPGYVLEGRIVTMGPQGVLPRGAIYIRQGRIHAVQKASAAAPAGFANAPRVRTGDTIYPGLIELHNHLCYNAMPLWDVPQRYTNNGQWKNHPDYRRLITKPAQVLGRSPGVVEALVRYTECRCLLGGVTTSQGITLVNAGGIPGFYRGVVRNVEQTGDPRLPEAGTRIANPDAGRAEAYLATLRRQSCYLQHLSEGTDDSARGWFHRLRLADGQWALTNAFCGIHSTALTEEDLRIIAEHGGSIVWSPLSNYLLYGQTLDLPAARAAGVLMGIGSDWAPSGSKNLLGELKVAWLANQAQGSPFTAEELVAMATSNSARILKWEGEVGTIEPGKRADLVAIDGQRGDDYLRVIEARETSVTLVAIDGIPRLGQPRLMERFGPGTEAIRIGGSRRVLNLAEESTHELVQGVTLGEATRTLREAMANLPALAQVVDDMTASGLFGGSADAQGETWQVVMDFEAEEPPLLAALPLAGFVQPMVLDGITVADDPGFLPRLAAARNLPPFVKRGLPPLYGEDPLPEGAHFLREMGKPLPGELLTTTGELAAFLRSTGGLEPSARRAIVDQALVLLEQNYVHLPLKRAMYAVDPVQRLRLLRLRLEEQGPESMLAEAEFHNELTRIFNTVRDLHTTYRLPRPYRETVAWLPFLIEECWERGQRTYVVSKVVGLPGPASFVPGVEVLYWNGMPIANAVRQNAERQAGGNAAARLARGLNSLTIRPLVSALPPDEEWVTLRYRGEDGQVHDYTQPWLVFEPGPRDFVASDQAGLAAATALGIDARTDDIQEVKKLLYAGNLVLQQRFVTRTGAARLIQGTEDALGTTMATVFRARPVDTAHGQFGYLRIFTFNVIDPDAFVDEFVRLVGQLPQDGLILDVRGNGGGHIHAAERLLQVLTPRAVEPQRAQFINTPLNLQICRRQGGPSPAFPGLDLSPWIHSIEDAVRTGATYSHGFPVTDPASCNRLGQRYFSPVVLIVDALCYSATDIFAAGFQDHEIGPILGTSDSTGAGGANVWPHALLQRLLRDGGEGGGPYLPLPGGADLTVAVRRMLRVGGRAGDVVEDEGIRPDEVWRLTRQDVMGNNDDLINRAAELLAGQPDYRFEVEWQAGPGGRSQAVVATHNVNRLDVLLNGRPCRSLNVAGDRTLIDLAGLADCMVDPTVVELQGYDGSRLVARYRQQMPVP